MASDRSMEFELRVRDVGTRVLKQMEESVKRLESETQKLNTTGSATSSIFAGGLAGGIAGAAANTAVELLGQAFRVLQSSATAAAAALREVVAVGAPFETSMLQVAALSQEAGRQLGELSEQVQETALQYGLGIQDASQAMFNIISATGDAANANNVLAEAAKLAAVGQASLNDSSDALVRTMNAYSLSADQAQRVSEILFATQQGGILTVGELAQNIGMVVPAAAAAGVSLEEMGASIATATKVIRPEIAITGLRNLFIAISGATEDVSRSSREMAAEVGNTTFEFSQAGLKALGYQEFLKQLVQVTGGSAVKLQELGIETRTLGVAMQLINNDGKTFHEMMKLVGDSAGVTGREFEKMSESASFKLRQLGAELDVIKVQVWEEIAPTIKEFADEFLTNFGKIKAGVGVAVAGMKVAVMTLAPAVLFLGEILAAQTAAFLTLASAAAGTLGLFSDTAEKLSQDLAEAAGQTGEFLVQLDQWRQQTTSGIAPAVLELGNAVADWSLAVEAAKKKQKDLTAGTKEHTGEQKKLASSIGATTGNMDAASGVAQRFADDLRIVLSYDQIKQYQQQFTASLEEIRFATQQAGAGLLSDQENQSSSRVVQLEAETQASLREVIFKYQELRRTTGYNEKLLGQIQQMENEDALRVMAEGNRRRVQLVRDMYQQMRDASEQAELSMFGVLQGSTQRQIAEVKIRYNRARAEAGTNQQLVMAANQAEADELLAIRTQQTQDAIDLEEQAALGLMGVYSSSTQQQIAEVHSRYMRLQREAEGNKEAQVRIAQAEQDEITRIKAQDTTPKNFGEGFLRQLDTMNEEALNTAKIGARVAVSLHDGLSGAFQAIITGSASAKEAFAAFGKQILATMAEIAAKALASKLIGALLQGVFNIASPVGGATQTAANAGVTMLDSGGVVTQPTLAMIGERRAEAVIPLEEFGRVARAAGQNGGGGTTNVKVDLTVHAVDSRSFKQMLAQEGDQIGDLVADAVTRRRNVRSAIRMASAGR